MIRALTLICTRLSKTLFFNFYSIENQLFLGSIVGAICKSSFKNKAFRTALELISIILRFHPYTTL